MALFPSRRLVNFIPLRNVHEFTSSVTLVHCIIISEGPPRIFLLPYVLHEGQAALNLAGPSVLTFLWYIVFVTFLLLHSVKQISK